MTQRASTDLVNTLINHNYGLNNSSATVCQKHSGPKWNMFRGNKRDGNISCNVHEQSGHLFCTRSQGWTQQVTNHGMTKSQFTHLFFYKQ